MAKGGARASSGPPPDPNALRRDRDKSGEWITLPSDGRDGSAPEWPLAEPTTRELRLWGSEWARPQAVMWERNGQQVEVALYVRALVTAEGPKATAADRVLVLRFLEQLGLSVPGLARNRWRIGQVDVTASATGTEGRARGDVRARLGVVKGGRSR